MRVDGTEKDDKKGNVKPDKPQQTGLIKPKVVTEVDGKVTSLGSFEVHTQKLRMLQWVLGASEHSIDKIMTAQLSKSSVRCAEQPSLLFQEALLRWVLQCSNHMPIALVQSWEHTMGLTITHCGPMFGQGDLSERWSDCRTWISGTLSTPMQVHALMGAMQNNAGRGLRFGAAIVMDKAWPKPKLQSRLECHKAIQTQIAPAAERQLGQNCKCPSSSTRFRC